MYLNLINVLLPSIYHAFGFHLLFSIHSSVMMRKVRSWKVNLLCRSHLPHKVFWVGYSRQWKQSPLRQKWNSMSQEIKWEKDDRRESCWRPGLGRPLLVGRLPWSSGPQPWPQGSFEKLLLNWTYSYMAPHGEQPGDFPCIVRGAGVLRLVLFPSTLEDGTVL